MAEKPIPAYVRRIIELWHMKKQYKEIIAIWEAEGVKIAKHDISKCVIRYSTQVDPPEGFTRRVKRERGITPNVKRTIELWHTGKSYKEILTALRAEGIVVNNIFIESCVANYSNLVDPPEGFTRRVKLNTKAEASYTKRAIELWHTGKSYREISRILKDEGITIREVTLRQCVSKYAHVIDPPEGVARRIKQRQVKIDRDTGNKIIKLYRAGKTYAEITRIAARSGWGVSYYKIQHYIYDNIIAPPRRENNDDYSDLTDIEKPAPENPTMPEFKPNEHYIFYEQNTAQRPPVTKVLTFKALNKDKALFANEFGHRETFTASQLVDYKIQPAASA